MLQQIVWCLCAFASPVEDYPPQVFTTLHSHGNMQLVSVFLQPCQGSMLSHFQIFANYLPELDSIVVLIAFLIE